MILKVSVAQSNNIKLQKNKLQIYDSLGIFLSKHNNNKRAIFFFKKAIAIEQSNNDSLSTALTFEQLSYSYQILKQYRQAIACQIKAVELRNDTNDIYYKRVKQLIPKANDSLFLTRLYYRYALFLSNHKKKKQGIDFYIKALQYASGLHYDKAISTIANDLAGEYWDLGKKKLSTFRYKEALNAAIRLNDSNRMAAIFLNLGDNYKELGNLEKGMVFLLKALKLKESIKDSSRLSFYYIKAAEISKVSLNYKKWIEYINKAYEIKDLDNCATSMEKAIIYQNLGDIAEHNNEKLKAFHYYDTLMNISRKINYINGVRVALNSRAQLYISLNKPSKALKLLFALDKYTTENPFYKISDNNTKADLYLKTKNYKKALRVLKENISYPTLSNYSNQKLYTMQLLYKVNIKLTNYKEALRWNDSLRNFEDYLRNKSVREKIAELETKYQSEKNARIINTLKSKNEIYNQQIRFAILLIAGLVIVILFGVFLSRISKIKSQFRENMLQQQFLRSQMNPHFIFNALSSIKLMINDNDTERAAFYLSNFATLTRRILEFSDKESISLDKEIEMLKGYIELEKLHSNNDFEYKFNFANDLDTEFINIPPMAIQPFVENAIKHGLVAKSEKGLLQITFKDMGDKLKVVIEDNGIGIKHSLQNARKQHKSMAMDIFEKRRTLLQKRYKKKLIIKFKDLSNQGKKGTQVIIHLPIL